MNKSKKESEVFDAQPTAKKERTVTEYVAILTALLARLGDGPGAADRAFYESRISDAEAHADGTRVESGEVVAEWCRVVEVVTEAVLAGKVAGFGKMRLHYACGVVRQLAEQVAVHDQVVVSAAGSSGASSSSLMSSRSARRTAIRALRSLAGRDEAARSRLHAAADAKGKRPAERSRSLNALAAELDHAVKTLPPGVVSDAGITQTLIDSLHAAARSIVAAKSTQHSGRGAVAGSYDLLNVLDGRVLLELRTLIGAAREARVEDRSVPAVASPLVASRHAKKDPAKKPAAPIVAPVARPTMSPPAS